MGHFRWSEKSEIAAQELAKNKLTYVEISTLVGITRMTLWEWRQNEEFQGRVQQYTDDFREEVRRVGIADHHNRVNRLNDMRTRMCRLIEARADDPEMQRVPGGSTGLLVKTIKSVGFGDMAQIVEEYEIDHALLKELREHEKQAAQELGQWVEKGESKIEVSKRQRIKIVHVNHSEPRQIEDDAVEEVESADDGSFLERR